MPIKSHIIDPTTGIKAEVINGEESNALAVATRPLKTYSNSDRFFFNTELGIDMNVAAVFTGTPLDIHDGTDKTQWTATPIVGGTRWDVDDNNHHAKDSVITIIQYANLTGETITISINNVVTVITEGVDYNAVTSNTQTATNLATFMDTIIGISASSDVGIVTLIADDDYDIDNLTENSSSSDLTATARCIQATASVNNDVLEIKTTGADIDLNNYAALTGWIYISDWDTRGTKGIEIELWLNGLQAENTVVADIKNFITVSEIGKWQKFTIPFSEFAGATNTIDSIRIKTIDIGAGQPPGYYLDYLQFQEIGTVRDFELEPKLGTWLHVHTIKYSIVDEYDGGVAVDNADDYWKPNGLPSIPYNAFLGVNKLSNGLVFKTIQDGEIIHAANIKQLMDITQMSGAKIDNYGSDGTNTWMTISHTLTEPFILKSENADKFVFSVADDLSGLLQLRVIAGCKVEQRE